MSLMGTFLPDDLEITTGGYGSQYSPSVLLSVILDAADRYCQREQDMHP
jgi:hypothetical protein